LIKQHPIRENRFYRWILISLLITRGKRRKTYNYRDIAETEIAEEQKKLIFKEINNISKISKELDLRFEKV